MSAYNSQTHTQFHADVNRSSYRWIIRLTNHYEFYGYSKKENKEEVKDKVKLFQRKMIMLKKKNYFDPKRTISIDFYKRTGLGEFEERLVTLYPSYYDLGNNVKFNANQSIQKFLELFYELIRIGKIDQLDYSYVGYSKISEEELFKLSSDRFRNIEELQKWCNDQIIQGVNAERVYHYQRQYKDLFFTQLTAR